jgi:hypothetical protein
VTPVPVHEKFWLAAVRVEPSEGLIPVMAALAVPAPHPNATLMATPTSSLAADELMRDIKPLHFLYMVATFLFGPIQ